MSISQLNGAEGPPDSAVQNRLTAAGLVLATLFFAGSFAMQLHAQSKSARTFAETFAYLEVALVVGALMAIASITGLLACQQCLASDRAWYKSKRVWFIVATVAQYLSISQAMSAGLTELVFGIKHTFEAAFLAHMLAVAASIFWVLLLWVAPIHALRSWWPHLWRGERVIVAVLYVVLLMFLLLSNAMIYAMQDGASDTWASLLWALLQQFLQPMMWLRPWAGSLAV
jgi:preprotein translocase subunit SecG